MTVINIIIILLLITPIIGVITDYKETKIKNIFIFPYLTFLLILACFIDGFFTSADNLLQLTIIFLFGYFFYINKKWGAGDGKYLIIVGLSSVIIGYLKGIKGIIINLFIFSFGIFLFYNIFYLIYNFKKIHISDFINVIKINILESLFYIGTINIIILLLSKYLTITKNYSYLFTFILLTIFIPLISNIKIKYINILVIIVSLLMTYYYNNYNSLFYTSLFFLIFSILSNLFEIIYDKIDLIEIPIINLKQGDVIDKKSSEKILIDSNIKINYETPLQGLEVYKVLDFYKKNNKENELINIYKDIKIGIYIYIGFILSIFYSIF